MPTLARAAAPIGRSWTRHALPTTSRHTPSTALAAPAVTAVQRRGRADAGTSRTTFESPFKPSTDSNSIYQRSGGTARNTYDVPDFGKYKSNRDELTNRVFQYFMVGTFGALTAMGAKATIQDFLVNMSASADVLAQAKVEIDLAAIPEGKNVIIKWRGKPVFIRHRTDSEIKEAEKTKWESLRDPQPDSERVQKPEWLIMLGVCTHLGCVPIGESGDFGGWFCPCHGSHYDISGRARKGPAPLNLEVPAYSFPTEESVIIG
ncbi:MAG: hsp70 nucleotide exchange factor fes1 [Chrysothrix sp. TS-e1954]|nr:MAG: hsp70 nucleotide exchange factor fes1 [Chrysothrix sp. TS-e1954]